MEQEVEVAYKKFREGGVRLVAEALEPAAIVAVKDLMHALEDDVRFESLSLILSSVVGKGLQEELLTYALAPLGQVDVAVQVMNVPAGMQPQLLYGAKKKFGAEKLVYITSGLQSSVDFSEAERAKMDAIDLVIANDELCADLYRLHYPWMDPQKIVATGTSLIDAILKEDGPGLRMRGRGKLAVADSDTVVFFSAFPGSDYASYCAPQTICVDALREVIAGTRLAALQETAKKFLLLVRPHPRMSEQETTALYEACNSDVPNLVIVANSELSYEESLYASELVACMATSTLSNLSRYRGQTALVLAFSDNACGAIFDRLFPPAQTALFSGVSGIALARTLGDVAKAVLNPTRVEPPKVEDDSTTKLLSYLLTQ